MKRRGTATSTATAITVLVLAGTLASCNNGVTRALDCAKTAATVAGDIQDLQSNATNIGQVSDPSRRKATVKALDKVQTDLTGIGHRSKDRKVDQAVTNLSSSVSTARAGAADGKNPDLRPVVSAGAHLTAVCTPG